MIWVQTCSTPLEQKLPQDPQSDNPSFSEHALVRTKTGQPGLDPFRWDHASVVSDLSFGFLSGRTEEVLPTSNVL